MRWLGALVLIAFGVATLPEPEPEQEIIEKVVEPIAMPIPKPIPKPKPKPRVVEKPKPVEQVQKRLPVKPATNRTHGLATLPVIPYIGLLLIRKINPMSSVSHNNTPSLS